MPGDVIYLSIVDSLNFYRNCLCACLCLSLLLVLPQAAPCKDCFLRQRDRALAFCCSQSILCHLCSRRISFFILQLPRQKSYTHSLLVHVVIPTRRSLTLDHIVSPKSGFPTVLDHVVSPKLGTSPLDCVVSPESEGDHPSWITS